MSQIKPLCRKRFLAQTIIEMDWLLRELEARHPATLRPQNHPYGGPKYMGSPAAKRGLKSLEQEDHIFFANEMWRLGEQFQRFALDQRTFWGRFDMLKADIWSPHGRISIGSMVFVRDASHYRFFGNAVGQLLRIEQEPRRGVGGRRYYEEDGGPARMSEQYVIRLLDGTEFTWWNASIGYLPTARSIQMHRKIIEDVYGAGREWDDRFAAA